jgi:3'-phosphoadenosine 5'-phosphosulfate sulfotransferase (PAPS reductase)/FAD synthetase
MKHVVGFSGGIDSQACAGWVLEHFAPEDVILLNTRAGENEHPITVAHVEWYSQHVHPVVVVKPIIADLENRGMDPSYPIYNRRHEFADSDELTFQRLAYIRGRFPSHSLQFCTEHLKLIPQRRWTRENIETDSERYIGVRRDESSRRAQAAERGWDDFFDCYINRPLVDWSKEQCFDFVKARGEEINPLYKMGFARVGCAPCVNSSKDDIRNWAARFPEMIQKVRDWEKQNGRTFFAPMVPGLQLNWVDECVEWSKTVWGGRQLSLPFFEAEAQSGNCSSKYGVCE